MSYTLGRDERAMLPKVEQVYNGALCRESFGLYLSTEATAFSISTMSLETLTLNKVIFILLRLLSEKLEPVLSIFSSIAKVLKVSRKHGSGTNS